MRTPFSPLSQLGHENEPEHVRSIMIEKYERCSFCNTKLIFSHDLNLNFFQVTEMGRCPGCGVTMRPRKFTLH